jgi:hypothetical protein
MRISTSQLCHVCAACHGSFDTLHLRVALRRSNRKIARAARAVFLSGSVDEPTGVSARDTLASVDSREVRRPDQHVARVASTFRPPNRKSN